MADRKDDLNQFVTAYSVPKAIEIMRDAGINDTLISVVVTSISSAAINAEFYRLQELMRLSPPYHAPHGEVRDAILYMIGDKRGNRANPRAPEGTES